VTWVKSQLVGPDGSPVVGACVTARVMTQPTWMGNRQSQVIGQVRANTDGTGVWRMNLLPHTQFETTQYVYYEVSEGRGLPTWMIRVPFVPDPNAELWLRDLIIDTPPSVSTPWTPLSATDLQLQSLQIDADVAAPGQVVGTQQDGTLGLMPIALTALLDVDEESLAAAKPGDQLVMLPTGRWGVSSGMFLVDVQWEPDPDHCCGVYLTVHGGSGKGVRVLWGDDASPTNAPAEEPVRHIYPRPGLYSLVARDRGYPTAKGAVTVTVKDHDPAVRAGLDSTGASVLLWFDEPGDGGTFTVDWGDGAPHQPVQLQGDAEARGPVAWHQYGRAGSWTLQITDDASRRVTQLLVKTLEADVSPAAADPLRPADDRTPD
jgi:hypothetical protein